MSDASSRIDRTVLLPPVELILTAPRQASRFENKLREVTGSTMSVETHAAFLHLAELAQMRFVVMTPFIDTAGAAWVTNLFKHCAAPERILIVRNRARYFQASAPARAALEAAATSVLRYCVQLPSLDGQEAYETFHAKIVLADGIGAYVGSANALGSSIDRVLEAGVLVRHRPTVLDVADTIDAVLKLAVDIHQPADGEA